MANYNTVGEHSKPSSVGFGRLRRCGGGGGGGGFGGFGEHGDGLWCHNDVDRRSSFVVRRPAAINGQSIESFEVIIIVTQHCNAVYLSALSSR